MVRIIFYRDGHGTERAGMKVIFIPSCYLIVGRDGTRFTIFKTDPVNAEPTRDWDSKLFFFARQLKVQNKAKLVF